MKLAEPGTWYCVVWIADSRGSYLGQSLAVAAIHLAPGTTFGKGQNHIEAQQHCWASAARFRRRRWAARVAAEGGGRRDE